MTAREQKMSEFAEKIKACRLCPLCEGRKNAVPGEGSVEAEIVFIGEAPGRNEDIQGKPFVGAAGKLLDALLASIGLSRQAVYITNVVKCRPPKNRDPRRGEIRACWPYLEQQIRLIGPLMLVTLGRHSTREVLRAADAEFTSITKVRGTQREVKLFGQTLRVMPILHPAAALYNPGVKKDLQDDFDLLGAAMRESHP